ncbi:hypothetical protein EWM64_g5257 [Hericium alpestre]|uniref:Uncharacterized protein n=1 Tax=Hericium alpestre TaxID=135208 RepID=A0A4Y9ZXF8_9AGAM|nr:hypothetical protein EWM64_g5257 [Hericium alpestre]
MATAAHIQSLLVPADIASSQQNALRLLNNDHTISHSTQHLAAAVDEAQKHRDQLKSSVRSVRIPTSELQTLISHTRASAASHLHTAQELSLLRHSLADELASLVEELVSSMSASDRRPTLLEDVETMHRNLKELESIKVYVQIIHHALQLREAAIAQVQSSHPIDVSPYQALQSFVSSVSKTCSKVPETTGQTSSVRIVAFLSELATRTWADMRAALSNVLLSAADNLRWPMPVDFAAAKAEDRQAFEKSFNDLLSLQAIGEEIHSSDVEHKEQDELYAIQALIQPVSLRFKYHFDGSRQTNRVDKPEWYFTHILNVCHEHRHFLETAVQSLLLSSKYRDIDAWREFTSDLFPLVIRRLKRSIPVLLPHPPLLAHTIYQALAFDASLKEEDFSLAGTIAGRARENAEWEGVSEVILGRKEWFERWMEGEKAFALEQYHEIISAPDAWLIADGEPHDADAPVQTSSAADRELRPTNSARQLKALVEQDVSMDMDGADGSIEGPDAAFEDDSDDSDDMEMVPVPMLADALRT